MNNDILDQALDELDLQLTERSLNLQIVICGAYAIQLHGFARNLHTLDVDSITELNSPLVLDLIQSVGKKLGIGPSWLNDQASTVTLPPGIFERSQPLHKWKSLKASLISRSDLICMKASAFSIRREVTNKDWEDLELLKPTQSEIKSAIEFLIQTQSPPAGASPKIKSEFQETLDDLKKLVMSID